MDDARPEEFDQTTDKILSHSTKLMLFALGAVGFSHVDKSDVTEENRQPSTVKRW